MCINCAVSTTVWRLEKPFTPYDIPVFKVCKRNYTLICQSNR